jgi:tripartite-type tricarboxylate transporter receptor subunit TctC
MIRRFQCAAALGLALLLPQALAAENKYPSHPVRFVVPFAPGGGSDITARVIGQKLGERLGQTFVIDNRSGAASLVGIEIVAKAPGDGYTLILADVPITIFPAISTKPSYDALKDFAPIARIATAPQVLAAHPSFRANSLKELMALPRAQTEKIPMGTSGQGSSPHMSYELLRIKTGLVLNHVPYKGGGPAVADVVAGQIPLAFNASPPIAPHIQAGRLKGLGMTAAARSSQLPGVPTFIESGVPDFVVAHWYGVLASAGTPPDVVNLLYREIARALEQPDVKERFANLVLDVAPLNPAEFRKLIESDSRRWKEVVVKGGVKIN